MTSIKRLRAILPFVLLALLAGLAVATQAVAAGFYYPREFGRGLFDLGRVRLYEPWAVLEWYGATPGPIRGRSTKRPSGAWRPP